MKCLHCGYCCINYSVVIVDNPEKGIVDNNLIFRSGQDGPCKHLREDTPGKYVCMVHHYSWYKDTPCFEFSQIEKNVNTKCRMGEYVLKNIIH